MKEKENQELGFGNRHYRRGVRLINPDGSFNVVKTGRPRFRAYDLYNNLLTMSWMRFALLVFFFYFVANLVFSVIYLLIGIEHLDGTMGETPFEHFLDAYFFSAQTITTLGYGRISPMGTATSIVASIESLVGLLGFALATGLLYGRFSRPVARIRFSKNLLVSPYRGFRGLMFRLVNERSSELIEVEIQLVYSYIDQEMGRRRYVRLDLELDRINFLSLSWTVVHPLEESSPLYHLSAADLEEIDAEFLILIKGFDESFSQVVYQRHSYRFHEMLWGRKFVSMINFEGDESLKLELPMLDDVQEAPLPPRTSPPK